MTEEQRIPPLKSPPRLGGGVGDVEGDCFSRVLGIAMTVDIIGSPPCFASLKLRESEGGVSGGL
jgi:hypothetical protein